MSKVDLADDRFGRRYQGGGAGISVVALHDGVDLTLLVHAQPDGIVGRVEVGPDDVARLLDNEGPLEGLKWRWQCGCTPDRSNQRCTADLEMRTCSAMARTLQCVLKAAALGGNFLAIK